MDIPTPGKLPQDNIFQALVLLLTALGVASLFLSVFLLISTVSALLNQQVRQIGVMKAIGGRSGQIARLYLGMVAFFGLAALAIAAPLSAWAARYIINFLAYLVDFTLGEFSIPSQVLAFRGRVGHPGAAVGRAGSHPIRHPHFRARGHRQLRVGCQLRPQPLSTACCRPSGSCQRLPLYLCATRFATRGGWY